MNDSNPPKPRRRWYQFSLRTLSIVLLVLGVVGSGWIGVGIQRARTNRDRIEAIEKELEKAVAAIERMKTASELWTGGRADGVVYIRHEELRPQSWMERLFNDPGDADDPVIIPKINTTHIFTNRNEAMSLNREAIRMFCRPECDLILDNALVTDTSLEHLKAMTNVVHLDLGHSKVTDAGLEHLKGMTNLKYLFLYDTQVTNAGLEHLKGLTNLKSLYVHNTQANTDGVDRLQDELPNCEIWDYRNRQHLRR